MVFSQISMDEDGKLIISETVMQALFAPCVDEIVKKTKYLLSLENMRSTTVIMLVGGFSGSPILKNAMERAFPRHKICVPQRPLLAVVQGNF